MSEATILDPVGTARPHAPEKLVIAAIVSDPELLGPVRSAVESELGELDWASDPLRFDYTRYYEAEMGPVLTRFFMTLKALADPADLARIKLVTNGLEARLAVEGHRRVNLDPGLLSLSRFVLASTKDSSHRVPLGHGIYAEITLVFERGEWRPVEWTYPDYASAVYRAILKLVRSSYAAEIRARAQSGKRHDEGDV